MERRTLSPAQFAKAVGVSVKKIHALLDAGEIRHVASLSCPNLHGRRPWRKIPDFEVEDFLRRQTK